jgi:hypothetical protein
MTVAECIILNSIANVVFFDNIISQRSAMRPAVRQTSVFYCENKWQYEPDSCRISDLRRLSLETVHFYGNRLLSWLFLVSYTLSVYNVENRWEDAGDTGKPWLSLLITGFLTRDLSNTKESFYRYIVRMVVTVCYTWNTNEVQSVTNVKQNV